jgi:hypothetical protein
MLFTVFILFFCNWGTAMLLLVQNLLMFHQKICAIVRYQTDTSLRGLFFFYYLNLFIIVFICKKYEKLCTFTFVALNWIS